MEIITNRHKAPDEIVSSGTSDSDVRAEANRRTYSAGYTDRDGQPRTSRSSGAGKGDRPRPASSKYKENYEKIFGKQKLNVWPRDKQGNLL